MKKYLSALCLSLLCLSLSAAPKTVTSPDGKLTVTVSDDARYSVSLDGKAIVLPSALGFRSNRGDFMNAKVTEAESSAIHDSYTLDRIKKGRITYDANVLTCTLENEAGDAVKVEFCVSDNDVAFRYVVDNPRWASIRIFEEATSFVFPENTTTFLTPQSDAMIGWQRTKPSYEEEYKADAPMTDRSAFGEGFTFPCLFKIPQTSNLSPQTSHFWLLVSETGVDGGYVASHLSDYDADKGYTIAFPNKDEMQGMGSPWAGLSLPASTPWRTITVGTTLKPIVETTIAYDVVEPRYEATQPYKAGRYTWSWLVWQDESINYDDQVRMVDTAAAMGYEYVLVDNWWDTRIGRDGIVRLADYARRKGVSLLLWYNSNGYWNDAPQGPRNRMNTAQARNSEMAWLQKTGIAGIKVDFFGSDKQQMMQLYEDILADANRYGLQVVFHGCTLPRGWERMYPNFVASEAALASENVFFNEHHAKREGFELTMHPFARNAVAALDWGGVMMNHHMSRDNRSRHKRHTTDIFEMATAIVLQTSVNCVALYPNNLTELPAFELDFLRQLPTTWDEVQYIDGYPTQYVVLARRTAGRWYVGGLNGTGQPLTLTLSLPMLAGKTVRYYTDLPQKKGKAQPALKTLKIGKNGQAKVTMQPLGGLILTE